MLPHFFGKWIILTATNCSDLSLCIPENKIRVSSSKKKNVRNYYISRYFLPEGAPVYFIFIKYIPFHTNEICLFFLEKKNPLETNRVLTAIKIGIWKIRFKKRILECECTSILYVSEQSKW